MVEVKDAPDFLLLLTAAIACACGAPVAASDMPHLLVAQTMTTAMAERVEIWIQLTEAPVAGAPKGQLEVVRRQQDAVMARLKELGATEIARVTASRNAVAVAIATGKVPDIERISGVKSVSVVKHIERDPLPPTR